jgi:peptide deformylase
MTVRKLVYYPNACLKTPTKPVEKIDDDIRVLIDDMYETMYACRGVGLAAPQIGISLRVAVIDVSDDKSAPLCLVNPEILALGEEEIMHEGCLSIPGGYDQVKRATRVKIRAQDRDGKVYELEAEGLLAEAIQHEVDHLEGILYIDKISKLRRQRMIDRMRKHLKKSKS